MSNTTLHTELPEVPAVEHPAWCQSSEDCQAFTPWSLAVHRGPEETPFLESLEGDWETHETVVQASLHTVELPNGYKPSVIAFTVTSDSDGLELTPRNMRALAEWLRATADTLEGQK